MSEVSIRPALRDDLADLTEIYNHYVIHTPATFDIKPFHPEDRTAWFEDHSDGKRLQLIVAENPAGRIIGCAGSGKFRSKPAYESTVELTMYLSPNWVGQSIGSRLCRTLFSELAKQDVHRIVSGVSQPNEVSNALHRKLGFKEVGTFHEVGRKFDKYWDVTWFELDMSTLPFEDR